MYSTIPLALRPRCYYVAHTYLAGDKRPEAAALFGRCADRIEEAREKLQVGLGQGGHWEQGKRTLVGVGQGCGEKGIAQTSSTDGDAAT